jgi:hypothetical protein
MNFACDQLLVRNEQTNEAAMTEIEKNFYQTQVATLLGTAALHWCATNYIGGERICREALSITEEHLGKESLSYGWCLYNLGLNLIPQGKLQEAWEVLAKSLHGLQNVLGPSAEEVKLVFERLHDLYNSR